jgi:S1-C subfamily serine protease
MVPKPILERTFCVKFGQGTGTCFTIDVDNRQYIVTARHVLDGIRETDTILIQHDKQWESLPVTLVGVGPGDIDIAVVTASLQLSPAQPLVLSADRLFLSQDIYFLGFPYGLKIEVGPEMNASFPLPLVKKGIVSGFVFENGRSSQLLLDGHNNPGFSGGPVFYSPFGGIEAGVAGVISGYRREWESVYLQDQKTPLNFHYNTGIIIAWSVRHVLEIIKERAIGCPVGQT